MPLTKPVLVNSNYIKTADTISKILDFPPGGGGDEFFKSAIYIKSDEEEFYKQMDLDINRTNYLGPHAKKLQNKLINPNENKKSDFYHSYTQGNWDASVFTEISATTTNLRFKNPATFKLEKLKFAYLDDDQIPCGFSISYQKNSPHFTIAHIKNTNGEPKDRVVTFITHPVFVSEANLKVNLNSKDKETELSVIEEDQIHDILKEKINSKRVSSLLSHYIFPDNKLKLDTIPKLNDRFKNGVLDNSEVKLNELNQLLKLNQKVHKITIKDFENQINSDIDFFKTDNFNKLINRIKIDIIKKSIPTNENIKATVAISESIDKKIKELKETDSTTPLNKLVNDALKEAYIEQKNNLSKNEFSNFEKDFDRISKAMQLQTIALEHKNDNMADSYIQQELMAKSRELLKENSPPFQSDIKLLLSDTLKEAQDKAYQSLPDNKPKTLWQRVVSTARTILNTVASTFVSAMKSIASLFGRSGRKEETKPQEPKTETTYNEKEAQKEFLSQFRDKKRVLLKEASPHETANQILENYSKRVSTSASYREATQQLYKKAKKTESTVEIQKRQEPVKEEKQETATESAENTETKVRDRTNEKTEERDENIFKP